MPTISRAKRHKARLRRSASLLKRALRESAFSSNKNFSTLAIVLAQLGGELTVTQETIQSVVAKINSVQYAVEGLPDGGARIFLVEADAVPTVDAAALPTETLDEMKARMNAAHNDVPEALEGATAKALRLEREAEAAAVLPFDPTVEAGDPA